MLTSLFWVKNDRSWLVNNWISQLIYKVLTFRCHFHLSPLPFSDAPGGVMPYLEVDGKKLGQSMACARYVARQHGGYRHIQRRHIEAETKWTTFCRRHVQTHFLEWKWLYFDQNFIEICSQASNLQYASIGPDNGWAPVSPWEIWMKF